MLTQRRWIAGLAIGTMVASAVVMAPAETNAAGVHGDNTKSTMIYGIDDDNVIWEIDPVAKTFEKVNITGLTAINKSNAMAYDTDRDQFFFMYKGTSPSTPLNNSLVFWNDRKLSGLDSLTSVASLPSIGVNSGDDPANASYYDGAYWYFTGGNQILNRIDFTYIDGQPTSPRRTTYNLNAYAGAKYPASGYGDIAITNTGMLYGSTTGNLFYKIDLTKLSSTSNSVYTQIATNLPGQQLSFSADYSVLYGQAHGGGVWSTIDMNTGGRTLLGFNTPVYNGNGFRDLGGASTTQAGTTCTIAPPETSQNQTAHIGEAVPVPLKVLVVTNTGSPQMGVNIIFSVTSGGGSIGGEQTVTVATDVDGIATAPDWKLGTSPGANTVLADNVGTVCNITFNATGILGPTPDPDPTPDPNPPGPTPEKQVPIKPLDLPTAVTNNTTTTLTKLPIETNAGQIARVRATCTPLVYALRPFADVRAPKCTVFEANSKLKVRVSGDQPMLVRLRITSPEVEGYTAFKKVKVYKTVVVS